MPNYQMKTLPKGEFVFFNDLDCATTEADVQALIENRTGVRVPLERITMKLFRPTHAIAMVSFERQMLVDILTWAFSEDYLHGRPVVAALGTTPAQRVG